MPNHLEVNEKFLHSKIILFFDIYLILQDHKLDPKNLEPFEIRKLIFLWHSLTMKKKTSLIFMYLALHFTHIILFLSHVEVFVVLCAIKYHSYNLKNVKKTHGGVLLLVKLQASACNSTKSNTPPWVFFTFFKLCRWY